MPYHVTYSRGHLYNTDFLEQRFSQGQIKMHTSYSNLAEYFICAKVGKTDFATLAPRLQSVLNSRMLLALALFFLFTTAFV